jgi:hypothetical protein
MQEFTGRIEVARPPGEVFAFLSDTRSMPLYLQTVRHVVPQAQDRVMVEGEVKGHPYRDEGWLSIDAGTRRMRWGTGDGSRYAGELEVRDLAGRSEVSVRLTLEPHPAPEERMQQDAGSFGHGMRLALERTLGAIKAACEGAGAGMEPANKDTTRSADDLADSRPFGGSATLNPDI